MDINILRKLKIGNLRKINPMKSVGKASTAAPKLAAKAPEKKQSFGEAFKAARAANKGTFTWNGKSYNTQTKEDAAKKTTPAAAKPSTPAAKSAPATPAKKAEPAKKVELNPKTTQTIKQATGKQLAERSQTRHPDTSTYKRPGTPTKAKPGSGAPLKSYPSTQKCGGKTKKK